MRGEPRNAALPDRSAPARGRQPERPRQRGCRHGGRLRGRAAQAALPRALLRGRRFGIQFGLCCAGSSAGLMAMLVALGVMSVTWMAVIAVLVLGQKLLPAMAATDPRLAEPSPGLER